MVASITRIQSAGKKKSLFKYKNDTETRRCLTVSMLYSKDVIRVQSVLRSISLKYVSSIDWLGKCDIREKAGVYELKVAFIYDAL
jgi:hypothetical protein